MGYLINEQNLMRQRLLASVLNPFTEAHLVRLRPNPRGRWLDVGSGVGETTKMLAGLMAPEGECVGLEQNPTLVKSLEIKIGASALSPSNRATR